MTATNQKRVPFLLGPNWQGVPPTRECAPEGASFHTSLRECARDLEQRPETELAKPSAMQKSESKPTRLHLSLLQQASAWLNAKNVHAANKKMQVVQPATLDKESDRPWAANRRRGPQSSILAHLWSWLQAKYASSTTKRLRVAEMIPLGEKRFLAVVSVEGREFLIGGGASGVSVVTQLDAVRDTANAPRREFEFQGAIE